MMICETCGDYNANRFNVFTIMMAQLCHSCAREMQLASHNWGEVKLFVSTYSELQAAIRAGDRGYACSTSDDLIDRQRALEKKIIRWIDAKRERNGLEQTREHFEQPKLPGMDDDA